MCLDESGFGITSPKYEFFNDTLILLMQFTKCTSILSTHEVLSVGCEHTEAMRTLGLRRSVRRHFTVREMNVALWLDLLGNSNTGNNDDANREMFWVMVLWKRTHTQYVTRNNY